MTDATTLWASVKSSYPTDDLITLSSIRDRSATAVDDTAGADASQAVLDLWPIYAQADFDIANAKHVQVAKFAVISMLWRRGGTATTVAKVEWDEVWGADGMITRLRNTSVRGRLSASSNSDVVSSRRDSDGTKKRGWSDPQSLPTNFLPTDRSAVDE